MHTATRFVPRKVRFAHSQNYYRPKSDRNTAKREAERLFFWLALLQPDTAAAAEQAQQIAGLLTRES
jgi:hypothetical protein